MRRLSFDSCKLYTDGTGKGCFTHYLKHVTLNENFLASLSAGLHTGIKLQTSDRCTRISAIRTTKWSCKIGARSRKGYCNVHPLKRKVKPVVKK